MASTYNLSSAGTTKHSIVGEGGLFRTKKILDYSYTADDGQIQSVNSGSGTIQSDVIQLLDVPARHFVLGCSAYTATANVSSNLADLDIGDGSDTDGFHDGLDLTSAVNAWSQVFTLTEGTPNVHTGYDEGKFYSAADTIDLLQNTDATVVTGRIEVCAVMIDLT